MKCPYCGVNLRDDARQCYACGIKFENTQPQNMYANNNQIYNTNPPSNNNQPNNSLNPNDFKNNKSKSGLPVIIGFLLFICVLCYFMFFAGGGGSNNEQNSDNNNQTTNTENNNKQQPLPDNSITSVKKQSYIRTANAFISSIRTEVNSSSKLRIFETNTMFLVPVGDNNKCAYLEYGETSPFSKTWNYAYVGVKYDGMGYTYYFMSEDGSNIGIEFVSSNKMDEDNIFSTYSETNINKEISNKLVNLYNISSNEEVTDNDIVNLIKQEDNSIKKVVAISAKAGCRN